jgi:hypothetical protein
MLKYIMFFIFIALVLVFPSSAHAYLDPGTGSFVVQIIIAGVAVVALNIKIFWQKIKKLFLHFFKHNDEKQE